MSFQYYSEPVIPPPPPPGVQSVNDCGQPGVYVDNTDPLNPIVCFGGVITDATLTGNGTLALPLSVVPPSIAVNIGKTLYVSQLGNNATAVPYDIRKHYLTINAALTAAVAGDTIVVFPGVYTATNNLVKTGVNYYFMPGSDVTISGSGTFIFDVSAGQNIHVKGHGIFRHTDGSIIRVTGGQLSFDAHQCISSNAIILQTGGLCNFNCDTVDCTGNNIAIYPSNNATLIVNVREYIRAISRCIQAEGNSNVIINCPAIFNYGTHPVYNTNGALIVRINLTTGKLIINCDLMYSVNGNMVLINSFAINDGASFIGNIKRLVNNYNGGTTETIRIENKCNYFQFNGNIYSNAAGQNIGLRYINTNPLNRAFIEYNGNIYNNLNYAIWVNYGCTLNFSGDIYGNPEDFIATNPSGFGTLVYIQNGPNGSPISTVTFNSCLFHNRNALGIAIYKDMQLDGGGNEVNIICQLLDCGIYLIDDTLPVCDGLFVAVPNEYATQGSIGNAGFIGAATDATGLYYQYARFILNAAPIVN